MSKTENCQFLPDLLEYDQLEQDNSLNKDYDVLWVVVLTMILQNVSVRKLITICGVVDISFLVTL